MADSLNTRIYINTLKISQPTKIRPFTRCPKAYQKASSVLKALSSGLFPYYNLFEPIKTKVNKMYITRGKQRVKFFFLKSAKIEV
jgi:hypothetical protein